MTVWLPNSTVFPCVLDRPTDRGERSSVRNQNIALPVQDSRAHDLEVFRRREFSEAKEGHTVALARRVVSDHPGVEPLQADLVVDQMDNIPFELSQAVVRLLFRQLEALPRGVGARSRSL